MSRTTLIVPDIHHRWEQAEKIITAVGADDIIFLGDYFDDFNDTPEMVEATSKWLISSVNKPNRVHLFGNHDVHYAFSYRTFQCSGYEDWKYFIIHDLVPSEIWDKLKWYHFLDNRWFLSHAGLHKQNVPGKISVLRNDREKFYKAIDDYLQKEIHTAFRNGANNQASWIFNAGHSRGGFNRVGGITWCDYEREFFPVKGLNQIVGHTPQGLGFPKWCVLDTDEKISYPPYEFWTPLEKTLDDPEKSVNIDLDVHGNTHYGVWNGKKLSVGSYKDL
jgi:hypothetical protein